MLFCPGALDLSRSARTLVVDLISKHWCRGESRWR